MAKIKDEITSELARFIHAQALFFVATAPIAGSGHVNISPKGLDTFRVLSPSCVAYLDLTGSGNETAAHVRENGRITFMFCSFDRSPMILRIYGRGRVILPDSREWNAVEDCFPTFPGVRQIIVADVDLVQTSCGFGVPRMERAEQRETLVRWAEAKGEDGLRTYRAENNVKSLDGLPAPGAGRPAERA